MIAYIGIDYSINSPSAAVKIGNCTHLIGFTQLKSVKMYKAAKCGNFHFYVMPYPFGLAGYDRYKAVASMLYDKIQNVLVLSDFKRTMDEEIYAIEDFNPNPKSNRNNIIDMVEAAAFFKIAVYNDGKKLYKLDISRIKKYATGSGAAKKDDMLVAWKFKNPSINIPEIIGRDWDKHPTEDMIDAYFISEMLYNNCLRGVTK